MYLASDDKKHISVLLLHLTVTRASCKFSKGFHEYGNYYLIINGWIVNCIYKQLILFRVSIKKI
jgi:hypothetical protein